MLKPGRTDRNGILVFCTPLAVRSERVPESAMVSADESELPLFVGRLRWSFLGDCLGGSFEPKRSVRSTAERPLEGLITTVPIASVVAAIADTLPLCAVAVHRGSLSAILAVRDFLTSAAPGTALAMATFRRFDGIVVLRSASSGGWGLCIHGVSCCGQWKDTACG